MRELFVYFKAPTDQEKTVRSHLQAMQNALRQNHPDLVTRLLMRPEASQGLHTWMEVYTGVADLGSGSLVDESISRAARVLAPFIVGTRKTEVFVVCNQLEMGDA